MESLRQAISERALQLIGEINYRIESAIICCRLTYAQLQGIICIELQEKTPRLCLVYFVWAFLLVPLLAKLLKTALRSS